METMKTESRDKDLRLQSLQSKVRHHLHFPPSSNLRFQMNHLRERSRAEDDRNSKEKDMVSRHSLHSISRFII